MRRASCSPHQAMYRGDRHSPRAPFSSASGPLGPVHAVPGAALTRPLPADKGREIPAPPCGGRMGWGHRCHAFTPTRTLPHQGGGRVLCAQAMTRPPPVSPLPAGEEASPPSPHEADRDAESIPRVPAGPLGDPRPRRFFSARGVSSCPPRSICVYCCTGSYMRYSTIETTDRPGETRIRVWQIAQAHGKQCSRALLTLTMKWEPWAA
jgi:hypothetical protein